MNKNAKAWVKALRSGEYKQGKSYLRRGDRYCCLGVACDLYQKSDKFKLEEDVLKNKVFMFDGNHEYLPLKVYIWLGLTTPIGIFTKTFNGVGTLYSLNDKGSRFKTIAKFIESEPEGLFTN